MEDVTWRCVIRREGQGYGVRKENGDYIGSRGDYAGALQDVKDALSS